MTVRVDWLAFTLRGLRLSDIQEHLVDWVPGEFVELEAGGSGYQRAAAGPGGCRVRWSPGREDIHAVLPGQWLGAVEPGIMLDILDWVHEHSWHLRLLSDGHEIAEVAVTRLDLSADDFAKVAAPSDVRAAVEAGNVVTHTREGVFYKDRRSGGETYAIGKRGSRQYLRVYDKAIESGGEVDSVRWELESRDEAAAGALSCLRLWDWGEVFRSRLVSFVDFRDRTVSERPERCPRLGWFEQLVGDAVKARPYAVVTPVASAEKSLAWLRRQVAPSLAAVHAAAGGDLGMVESLLMEGRSRWKAQHVLIAASELAEVSRP
jgi:hypothetical protein